MEESACQITLITSDSSGASPLSVFLGRPAMKQHTTTFLSCTLDRMTNATEHDYAAQARQAIEIVCSGEVSRMEEFYSPDFVDHVNDMTFHGYAGGRESLAFYATLFRRYRMSVEEQVTEGNRVASRWVLNGTYHGRAVVLRGISISRFGADGRALEDHGHS